MIIKERRNDSLDRRQFALHFRSMKGRNEPGSVLNEARMDGKCDADDGDRDRIGLRMVPAPSTNGLSPNGLMD